MTERCELSDNDEATKQGTTSLQINNWCENEDNSTLDNTKQGTEGANDIEYCLELIPNLNDDAHSLIIEGTSQTKHENRIENLAANNVGAIHIGDRIYVNGDAEFTGNIGGSIYQKRLKESLENRSDCTKKAQTIDADVTVQKPKRLRELFNERSFQIWLGILVIVSLVCTSILIYYTVDFSAVPSSPMVATVGHDDDLGDGIQIIHRNEWSARPPLNTTSVDGPLKIVRILHTAGANCKDYQTCAGMVLGLQIWQVGTQDMVDLAWNYLIGGDGNVYVGRGPDVQNEWMPRAIDICYMGNFLTPYDQLTDKMEEAGKRLIQRLRKEGKITEDYVVIPQNQTYNTLSPGQNVYKKLIKWPHYDSSLYF